MLPVAMTAIASLGWSGCDGQKSPPTDQQSVMPTTTTTTTTTLPSEGGIRGVGVPLKQDANNSNKCKIEVDLSPVKAFNDDAIRWTATVEDNAGGCKNKKFKIRDVHEIDCTTKEKIPNSTLNPLEDCDRERDTGNNKKVRLICSVVNDKVHRCFKYTIKVGGDEYDPEIEVDPGVVLEVGAQTGR
jgi:hypothetical protein